MAGISQLDNRVPENAEQHPNGLYVLLATEIWERFSFYSMLALFTLYLRDSTEGFGWSTSKATSLFATYLMFVYLSPLVGGLIGDRWLGYRRAILIGSLFFILGHVLLSIRSFLALYAALICLIFGNGLFKPNVSVMVGNLYYKRSQLKDRAYNIFYVGINVGAVLAPFVMNFVLRTLGYRMAFATAAGCMAFSAWIQWQFRRYIEGADRQTLSPAKEISNANSSTTYTSRQSQTLPEEQLPMWKPIITLIVIFLVIIIFWTAYAQSSVALLYWGDENTDLRWGITREGLGSINAGLAILFTLPLIGFWAWLDKKGREPLTLTKIAIGMMFCSLGYFILFVGSKLGETSVTGANLYDFKVSPAWVIGAYSVLTLGELLIVPMGLSLVSKMAPFKVQGVMMGGWFLAMAIGNKVSHSLFGPIWEDYLHSTYFLILGGMAFLLAIILLIFLRQFRKAVPIVC